MNDENQSLIAEINSSLSLAAKRQNGLFKMISFLEKCTSSHECTLLEQNCPFWIRTIFQIFENHPVSLHAKLAQYAFYLIIQISKSLSAELQRHISTSLIEKAIILLISSNDLLAKNSLLCLNELISCYKTPCSQFRSKIENYVYTRLESDSDDLIKWSSICYSKLPYLHKNSNNTDIWYIYFTNMLHNGNSLLNELFEDYQPRLGVDSLDKQDSIEMDHSETINTSHRSEIRTFSKFTKDLDNLEFYYKKSLKRFKACLSCLTHLLKPLSERTCINVRPSEVIEFLKRIFLFDFKKLQNNCRINLESNYLDNIMSEMLICAFEFCTEFFSVLNTNLIPQTLVINNILLNIGHSIAENNTSSVLTSYYACLNSWMVSLGTNSAFYKNSFTLIENLLKKIKPFEKNAISIESNRYDTSKTKQKQRASVLFNQEKSSLNTFQIINQNKMVTSALDCLRTFLKTFSFNLSFNQFEKIHSSIIDMILYVQYNSNARKPYDQHETRLSLYEALFDLCLTKNTKIAPPLSVSIGLFKNALNDHDQRVQEYAKNTLNFLRAFTYPLQPVYSKEYVIESKAEISIISQRATDLVLPSITDENKQSLEFGKNDLQKSEIAQYMFKEQNSLNGIEINSEQTFDQATDTSNQQATKRKFNYEDDDEDEMNEPENENVYNPKSIAKKFQPNGNFQNRSLVNGRDAENSNGDDDEEEEELEEEVISLNEQGNEEDNFENESENEMEEDEEENDEDDEDEEQEEEEEEEEEEQESQQDKDDVHAQHDEQIEQVIEEPVVQQIIIEPEQQSDPPSEKEEISKEKSSSPSDKVAEEVKNLLKQTGDDYDDEESKEVESESLCKASQGTESDVQSQEISMNKFDDEQIECEKDKIINFENGNSQVTEGEENDKNEVSKVEEDESKPEDNEDFDETKFKQMCASLNVNAMAESN